MVKGDRYEWKDPSIGTLACEIAEIISNTECKVIKGTKAGITIPIEYYKMGNVRYWKFIGNFNKSENFNNLYKLLSE